MKTDNNHNATMLDRYLASVGNLLPAANRGDILAELRANLTAEMDDRAETLGHGLSEDDEAEILRAHGHPMAVAARYFPQQHLIGPAFIAIYWFVLKMSLGLAAAITLAVSLVLAALQNISGGQLLGMWLRFPGIALTIFAWVTLSFASTEYFARRYRWQHRLSAANWDPRKLPAIRVTGKMDAAGAKSQVFGALFSILWLVAVRHWAVLIPAAAVHHSIRLAPAWFVLYRVLLLCLAAGIVWAVARLARPDWKITNPAWHNLASCVLQLWAVNHLLKSPPWVTPLRAGPNFEHAVAMLNVGIHWSLLAWILGLGIAIVVAAFQSVKLLTGEPAAQPVGGLAGERTTRC